ncbi:sensor histidine kinase [Demequina sp. NBRC 110053]|uniref:sensor histidine kinase n=1 Tax=Demequina sp. NBRC 110053 TaxID=1570342 RepID=UPI000A00E0AC|nr:ATP-binding protein [Demequina sp. NBRC 110053]
MSALSTESARDRLQRALYTASGIGALVFGALMATGASGFLAQRDSLEPWYWWLALSVAVLLPMTLLLTPRLASLRVSRAIGWVSVIGFVAVQVLWVTGMSVDTLPSGTTPWIQGVTAFSCTIAAITWKSRWVWVAPILQAVLVSTVQIAASDTGVEASVLDGVGALVFCSFLAAIAQAVLKAGEAQDAAAAHAREAAMSAAAASRSERERARINAIVHDDIMSVLLAADHDERDPTVAARAADALAAVQSITAPDTTRAGYGPDELAAVLRSTTAALRADAAASASASGVREIPSAVAAAFVEALSEALRNTSRHAGAHARVSVEAVVSEDGVHVMIVDDGNGFDPRAVGPTRLGIRASMIGKMESIPGGRCAVDSAPGAGTRVALSWSAT